MADGETVAARRLSPKQVARSWTKTARAMFLEALADTCNVRMACAAAGLAVRGAYDLRRRDEAFRGAWGEALGIGYERLEEALLRHALIGLDEIRDQAAGTIARALSTSDIQMMLALLNRRRAAADDATKPKRRRPTPDETDAVLRAKLDKLSGKLADKLAGVG